VTHRALLFAAHRRSLAFLSDLSDPSAGVRQVERLAQPLRQDARSYRGGLMDERLTRITRGPASHQQPGSRA
jgi:hypothetical protein